MSINRHIICSDIHGCYVEFVRLLDKLNYSPTSDRLISCGDLVEKGPQSNEVVSVFRQTPNTISVKGNHEEGLVRYWKHEQKRKREPKYKNPMTAWEERVRACNEMNDENVSYLDNLPWFHSFEVDEKKYLALHGGLLPDYQPEEMEPNILCRLRYIRQANGAKMVNQKYWKMVQLGKEEPGDIFWAEIYGSPEFCFFGHFPFKQDHPKQFSNAMGIDLGGVYGNYLCGYIIESDSFEIVDCSKRI